MVLAKTDVFSTTERSLAAYARALAHPARIAILKLLARRPTCVCGEIVEELPLSQATVSQHLKVLKEVGLITGEIEGPRTCYCLNSERVRELSKLLPSFVESIARGAQKKRCC